MLLSSKIVCYNIPLILHVCFIQVIQQMTMDKIDFTDSSFILTTFLIETFTEINSENADLADVYNASLTTLSGLELGEELESRFNIVPILTAFVIFLFVTFINSLIIYVISRYKKLRTPSYTLMASIGVCDILHAGFGKVFLLF